MVQDVEASCYGYLINHPAKMAETIFTWWLVVVFNATFNNISVISWRSVLLVEETGENHRPDASH
jgi:hypothetical protein